MKNADTSGKESLKGRRKPWKRYLGLVLLMATFGITLTMSSCSTQNSKSNQYEKYAAFEWFRYEGKDTVYQNIDKNEDEYYNPVLAGFYPDPSICRVEDDFYMINSTFSFYPGIPIFHSKDLVNWEQIGYVMSRPSQLDLDSLAVSQGIFAPTIRYHNGTFYVICTVVGGKGNFYVKTENPEGQWSDPVWLEEIRGIDPSLFFADNGNTYIVHNAPPPDGEPLYDGHRTIRIRQYDLESDEYIGEEHILVNGGVDISKEPAWIEGPHIHKKDGYYYLIAAEGGTGKNHSEVVFRSRSVTGPYEPWSKNPILTQRHLDPSRKNPVTSTGHADIVKLPNGKWWSVFLGCRPYEDDMYNTGRETFLMPVEWKNGWPVITSGKEKVPYVHKKPELQAKSLDANPHNGNFVMEDSFNDSTLALYWNFLRTPRENWYRLDDGQLYIQSRKESIFERVNPSFIGKRQQHLNFSASTAVKHQLPDTSATAGMIAFQNEQHYLLVGMKKTGDQQVAVYVEKASGEKNNGKPFTIAHKKLEDVSSDQSVIFKIEGKGRYYSFYYKTQEKNNWNLLIGHVDASNLSTKVAGGFVGTYLGMYVSREHFNR